MKATEKSNENKEIAKEELEIEKKNHKINFNNLIITYLSFVISVCSFVLAFCSYKLAKEANEISINQAKITEESLSANLIIQSQKGPGVVFDMEETNIIIENRGGNLKNFQCKVLFLLDVSYEISGELKNKSFKANTLVNIYETLENEGLLCQIKIPFLLDIEGVKDSRIKLWMRDDSSLPSWFFDEYEISYIKATLKVYLEITYESNGIPHTDYYSCEPNRLESKKIIDEQEFIEFLFNSFGPNTPIRRLKIDENRFFEEHSLYCWEQIVDEVLQDIGVKIESK